MIDLFADDIRLLDAVANTVDTPSSSPSSIPVSRVFVTDLINPTHLT